MIISTENTKQTSNIGIREKSIKKKPIQRHNCRIPTSASETWRKQMNQNNATELNKKESLENENE